MGKGLPSRLTGIDLWTQTFGSMLHYFFGWSWDDVREYNNDLKIMCRQLPSVDSWCCSSATVHQCKSSNNKKYFKLSLSCFTL